MKIIRFILIAVTLSSVFACSDPAEEICDRAADCGGTKKRTREQCIADFKADLSKGQLEECANCVQDHACSEISNHACDDACDF